MKNILLLYTDPGSGLMLLQLILASIAGGVFYFRSFFSRIFGRKSSAGAENAVADNTTEEGVDKEVEN